MEVTEARLARIEDVEGATPSPPPHRLRRIAAISTHPFLAKSLVR